MSDYPLSLTGAEIDSALGKVHNADTAPTNASTNMVTSGGVHTAINNLDLTNLAGSSLVTESEGIGGNDNDNTIPTSAAVKDYVDSNTAQVGNHVVAVQDSQTSSSDFTVNYDSVTGSAASNSSGVVTVTGAGIWAVSFGMQARLASNESWDIDFKIDNVTRHSINIVSTAKNYFSGTTFVTSTGSFNFRIFADEVINGSTCTVERVRVEAIRLSQ